MALSVIVGLGAGCVAVAVAQRLGVTGWARLGAGGTFIGAVVGLGVADLIVPCLGPWWADRPMAAAALSGVMLAAITALVLEAVIERLDARRWRPAGVYAVARLGEAAAGWDEVSTAFAAAPSSGYPERWTEEADSIPGVHIDDILDSPTTPFKALSSATATAHSTMERTAVDLAPILTATDELNDVYVDALPAIGALQELAPQVKA